MCTRTFFFHISYDTSLGASPGELGINMATLPLEEFPAAYLDSALLYSGSLLPLPYTTCVYPLGSSTGYAF